MEQKDPRVRVYEDLGLNPKEAREAAELETLITAATHR